MKILLVFLVLCVSTALPVYIKLPSSKFVYSVDDDNLMEAAIFKALSPNGVQKVSVANYLNTKGAYTVQIFSDPEQETDVEKNLNDVVEQLGFVDYKIEESKIVGSNVKKEGILSKFVIFLDKETYVDVMTSFVDEIVDTTDVTVLHSRWD